MALSIFSIIKGEGWRSIAIAGHLQWVYLLIIALLRLLGTQRTTEVMESFDVDLFFFLAYCVFIVTIGCFKASEIRFRSSDYEYLSCYGVVWTRIDESGGK